MGSNSKPKKMTSQARFKDRISELPDAILCHMLSFIPTKYAMRTSILSTRWKSIWASVPNLDFEYEYRSLLGTDGYKSDHGGFLTFVDHVLSFRDSIDIKKFRLHCYCHVEDFSRIDGWIRAAIRHNVVELDLRVHVRKTNYVPTLELPQCVFMCKTLVVLKVKSNCITYAPPTAGCFLNLKFLHLSVEYPDNDSMERIFSCCPVLEDLTINAILGADDVLNFNISVPELKTLRLDVFHRSSFDDDREYIFIVNCPKLENLDIKQDILSNYFFDNVKSLVNASVNLWYHYADHQHDFSNRATALLAGFSNVKYLSLSAHFVEGHCLPALDNLSGLKLALHDCCYWDLLTELLKRSPNLEDLVVEHEEDEECVVDIWYSEHRWSTPEDVPSCLISHLKTITIRGFKGYPCGKKVAKYLFKNGKVLSKMTIFN